MVSFPVHRLLGQPHGDSGGTVAGRQDVIFANGYGDLSNDEIIEHNSRMIELLNVGETPLHMLLVTHLNTRLPTPHIAAGRRILTFIGHRNLEWNVAVCRQNTLMAKLAVILAKVARARYRQFADVSLVANSL